MEIESKENEIDDSSKKYEDFNSVEKIASDSEFPKFKIGKMKSVEMGIEKIKEILSKNAIIELEALGGAMGMNAMCAETLRRY
jgi:hypothetical protein